MKTILALVLSACVSFAQADENYDEVFESSKSIAVLAFPDVTKSDSAIFRKVMELNEKAERSGSPVFNHPNKPLILAIMAAKELGISVNSSNLSDTKLAIYRSIHGRIDEFHQQLNAETPQKKTAPVEIVEPAAPKEEPRAPVSDGLVVNPMLFDKTADPVAALSRSRVTPEEARQIVEEKNAAKEAARKNAQMNAILGDMDAMEQQIQSQQQEMQNARQRQQQFDQQAEAWRNRNR